MRRIKKKPALIILGAKLARNKTKYKIEFLSGKISSNDYLQISFISKIRSVNHWHSVKTFQSLQLKQ